MTEGDKTSEVGFPTHIVMDIPPFEYPHDPVADAGAFKETPIVGGKITHSVQWYGAIIERYLNEAIEIGKKGTDGDKTAAGMTYHLLKDLYIL